MGDLVIHYFSDSDSKLACLAVLALTQWVLTQVPSSSLTPLAIVPTLVSRATLLVVTLGFYSSM